MLCWGGISIDGVLLGIGITLGIFNTRYPKSLRNNVIRRLVFIVVGFWIAFILDKDFLHLGGIGFLAANLLGLGFLTFHLLMSLVSSCRRKMWVLVYSGQACCIM